MAGKWAAFRERFKPLPVEIKFADEGGTSYQDKVDAVKAALAGKDLHELGDAYNTLCTDEEEMKAFEKDLNVQFEAVGQMLATQLADRGMSSFKLKSGENFILKEEPHTTVKDKAAVREWFTAQGMAEILAPPWATLNAMVKGVLENPVEPDPDKPGEMRPRPMPEGIEVYWKTSVYRRKK